MFNLQCEVMIIVKPLLFYTIDDCTDDKKYCKRKGLKPHKTVMKRLDDRPFEVVVQYSKGGYVYDVLEWDQCYSGYMITLMRLPELSFDELLHVALFSNNRDERAGAIGMLLKNYSTEYECYLRSVKERGFSNQSEKKKLVRMVKYIHDVVKNYNSCVRELNGVLELCRELKK